mmetsp:Transcript_48746/g.143887  ORF Transcript_48746/g.143887 Transcript_48746/m.143887 type:complete len:400 (-) Transcript_48746:817-2016(-)
MAAVRSCFPVSARTGAAFFGVLASFFPAFGVAAFASSFLPFASSSFFALFAFGVSSSSSSSGSAFTSASFSSSSFFSFFIFLFFASAFSSSRSSSSSSSFGPSSSLSYMPLSFSFSLPSSSCSSASSSSSSLMALSSAPSVFFMRFLGRRPSAAASASLSSAVTLAPPVSSPSSSVFLLAVAPASAALVIRMILTSVLLSFRETTPFMKASMRSLLTCETRFSISRIGRNSNRQWYVKTTPFAEGTYWMLSFTASLARQSSSVTRRNLVRSLSAQVMRWSMLSPPLLSLMTLILMSGVEQDFEPVWTISRSLGMPSVTLAPPCPARWKVFSVICVLGSPMLCAAITPTASPGSARALMYFRCMKSAKSCASLSDIVPAFLSFAMKSWSLLSCSSEVAPK